MSRDAEDHGLTDAEIAAAQRFEESGELSDEFEDSMAQTFEKSGELSDEFEDSMAQRFEESGELPDEFAHSESPRYRSVRRLASWLLFLGFVAALGVGLSVGIGVGASINGKGAQYLVGLGVGLLAAMITITPYLVVVAVLDLLADIGRDVNWLTRFVYEQAEDRDLEQG